MDLGLRKGSQSLTGVERDAPRRVTRITARISRPRPTTSQNQVEQTEQARREGQGHGERGAAGERAQPGEALGASRGAEQPTGRQAGPTSVAPEGTTGRQDGGPTGGRCRENLQYFGLPMDE